MIRKLILGAVAVAAIGFGGQAATAGEPVRGAGPVLVSPGHPRHDHDYVVFVRHGGVFGHWDRYGRFETRFEAERAAERLERHGHRVRIEVVEGGRRW